MLCPVSRVSKSSAILLIGNIICLCWNVSTIWCRQSKVWRTTYTPVAASHKIWVTSIMPTPKIYSEQKWPLDNHFHRFCFSLSFFECLGIGLCHFFLQFVLRVYCEYILHVWFVVIIIQYRRKNVQSSSIHYVEYIFIPFHFRSPLFATFRHAESKRWLLQQHFNQSKI